MPYITNADFHKIVHKVETLVSSELLLHIVSSNFQGIGAYGYMFYPFDYKDLNNLKAMFDLCCPKKVSMYLYRTELLDKATDSTPLLFHSRWDCEYLNHTYVSYPTPEYLMDNPEAVKEYEIWVKKINPVRLKKDNPDKFEEVRNKLYKYFKNKYGIKEKNPFSKKFDSSVIFATWHYQEDFYTRSYSLDEQSIYHQILEVTRSLNSFNYPPDEDPPSFEEITQEVESLINTLLGYYRSAYGVHLSNLDWRVLKHFGFKCCEHCADYSFLRKMNEPLYLQTDYYDYDKD